MKTTIFLGVALALLVGLNVEVGGHSQDQAPKGEAKEIIRAKGVIEPQEVAEVGAFVVGVIKKRAGDFGTPVKKGDILAAIDAKPYEAEVDKAKTGLQKAEADLVLEHKEDIPTIPLQAVNHEADKTTVYVVTGNDRLEDRLVRLGIQTANDAEIVSGLHEGETVVVSDRAGLKPGEKVSPQIVQVMQYHESNQE